MPRFTVEVTRIERWSNLYEIEAPTRDLAKAMAEAEDADAERENGRVEYHSEIARGP